MPTLKPRPAASHSESLQYIEFRHIQHDHALLNCGRGILPCRALSHFYWIDGINIRLICTDNYTCLYQCIYCFIHILFLFCMLLNSYSFFWIICSFVAFINFAFPIFCTSPVFHVTIHHLFVLVFIYVVVLVSLSLCIIANEGNHRLWKRSVS